ncbi:MAG TPA: hypothetical protein VF767_02220 [Bryobacteraceae bacterium]
MLEDFRTFEATDPFGRSWKIGFLWQQNAISIRHADAVDVKFELVSGDRRLSKVIALPHPSLLELSRKTGRPLTDAWCSRLAALHLRETIETGEDMDKTVITPTFEMLERHHARMEQPARSGR